MAVQAKLWAGHVGSPASTKFGFPRKHSRPSCSPAIVTTSRSSSKTEGPKKTTAKFGVATTSDVEYRDNWFDRLAIDRLSKNLQSITGKKNLKDGYDGLIEATYVVAHNYSPSEQQQIVSLNLERTFPEPLLEIIRRLLPQSKFTRELFAAFTTVFFSWLVGPSEVRESEFQGKTEKNVVYINKCRFLEGTNCVSMCTNQCKIPSQKFIKEKLNMPVDMVPNFEDMSCEMIFGQEPPAQEDDPALKQPCHHGLCKAKQAYNVESSMAEREEIK